MSPRELLRFFAVLGYVRYIKFLLIADSPPPESAFGRYKDRTFYSKNCSSQGIENSKSWFLGQPFLKWTPLVGVRIPGGLCKEGSMRN